MAQIRSRVSPRFRGLVRCDRVASDMVEAQNYLVKALFIEICMRNRMLKVVVSPNRLTSPFLFECVIVVANACSMDGVPVKGASPEITESSAVAASKKRLPPLNTIAAFEASARHMSFTRAGDELHLSQGAVSRQIQLLETRMGVALFNRRHKEIQLTKAGTIFQQAIAESLQSIRRAVAVIETLDEQSVTISASVGMSSFWLMPAILAFTNEHPDINIRVLASDQLIDPSREPIDLTIRYGDVRFPGMKAVKLFDEEIFPVCSEAYQQSHSIRTPDDLAQQTLIEYDEGISAFASWDQWFKLAKIDHLLLHPCLTLTSYDLVYKATCAGRGVGLAWSFVIPEEARNTLLVRPLDISVRTGLAEYIVFSEETPLTPSAQIVLDWLIERAKTSNWTL